ncbi:MAG: hypothetical protein ACJAQ3_001360 [Planctomycetota bacterium]|jgi:hypothetical protein
MSQSAQFRIERKQTLEQRPTEKKKLSVAQEVTTDRLVIGTRSSADLVLDDPIAAEFHCAIRFEGGQFFLSDESNATGTFLNGVRLSGEQPVAPGDRIALGVSTIELVAGESAAELSLHVREGAFFYAMKKRGEFESDADEWVRSEVTFGRMPVLKTLNLLGIGAAVCAVLWLWFMPTGEKALQPGHLSSAHAALFSDTPPTDARFANAVEIAQAQGCAACHASFDQPSQTLCASCHSDIRDSAIAKESHPFGAGSALECSQCHREHHGETPPLGMLRPADVTQTCQDCHGADYQDDASLIQGLAKAARDFKLAPTTSTPVARRVSIGFEAFQHGNHEKITECSACHVETRGESAVANYAPVSFETCMNCHDDQPASDVPAEWLPSEDHRWPTAWHGSGDEGSNCVSCHDAPFAAELRMTAQVPPTAALFTLTRRSHDEFFHGTDAPGDCITCHKAGDLQTPRQTLTSRAFRHDQHLSSLSPDGETEPGEINGQCLQCHTDMGASAHLTAAPDAYPGPAIKACKECHIQDGAMLLESTDLFADLPPPQPKPDFPHDRHMDVEDGCFACHSFTGDAPGLVQTANDAASCVRCHVKVEEDRIVGHASIGGGDADSCSACHAARGASSPGAAMAAVFYGDSPGPSGETKASTFPHFLEAHQGATCIECHGALAKGSEIHSPPESAKKCRNCHAANRFHWR